MAPEQSSERHLDLGTSNGYMEMEMRISGSLPG